MYRKSLIITTIALVLSGFFKYEKPSVDAIVDVEAVHALESVKAKKIPTASKLVTKTVKQAPTAKPVAVAPAPTTGNCSLVNNYDWPKNVAYGVCMAESRGNSNAINWGDNHGSCVGSYGLMQVGCFWFPFYGYSVSDGYNPAINMLVAYKIWQRSGFSPWTTWTSGAYLQYL